MTLGYHYQWTERKYDPTQRSLFPPSLAALAADLGAACGDPIVAEAQANGPNYIDTHTVWRGTAHRHAIPSLSTFLAPGRLKIVVLWPVNHSFQGRVGQLLQKS